MVKLRTLRARQSIRSVRIEIRDLEIRDQDIAINRQSRSSYIPVETFMSYDPTDLCAEIQAQLAAYALGEAEAEDELLEHLAICPDCQRDLRAYVQVARMLPYDVSDVAPPPDLRARILAAVEESVHLGAEQPAQPAESVHPGAEPPAQLAARQIAPAPRLDTLLRLPWGRRLPVPRLAFALVVGVVVALLGWNISLQRQLSTQQAQIANARESWQTMIVLLNDPNVRWYDLTGDTAKGHFWIAPRGKVGCLVVQGLPALMGDQVYQVWLRRGAERTSGGTFEARNGNGWVLVQISEPLANYNSLGVTIEPRGGSAAPTSPPILQGSVAEARAPTVADRQQTLRRVALNAPRGD
jgi:Anti-sigma-K factor rskA, C-terminal